MSTVLKLLFALGAASMLVAGYATWYVLDEETDNRRRCEAIDTRPVSVGSGKYICVTQDGRVVAP